MNDPQDRSIPSTPADPFWLDDSIDRAASLVRAASEEREQTTIDSRDWKIASDGSNASEVAEASSGAGAFLCEQASQTASRHAAEPRGNRNAAPTIANLLVSTLLSLAVVLILLLCLRFILPPMLESSRYSWHRGQLRAEYEMAGDQLERVSWEGLSQVSRTVVKRASPSVVHITVSNRNQQSQFLSREPLDLLPRTGPNREQWRAQIDPREFRGNSGQGSGVIIDAGGYILTNYHVLEGAVDTTVYLADDRVLPAEIIGVDRTTDLALLKIDAEDLMPIAWGDSDQVDVGSPVWAVGSPFGLTGSVSFGILSGKHRVDLNANVQYRGSRDRISSRYSDLMQSDVAVNPGNSGGPLVNGRGEMIGINTAIVGESYRGVSFSIPSNLVREVYDQFMKHGRVRRGWLGVELVMELQTGDRDSNPGNPSIVVKSVVPDSPAALAGIYPGDRITHFDKDTVLSVEHLIDAIRDSPADSNIHLTIRRSDEVIEVIAKLGELSFAP
jgi:serine protease Do